MTAKVSVDAAPPPVRPGMRYTHMDTEAAPMMTTRRALVMRLSVCRKRIMDGLEPSTLYARTWRASRCKNRTSCSRAHPTDAQFSRNSLLARYSAIIDEWEPGGLRWGLRLLPDLGGICSSAIRKRRGA